MDHVKTKAQSATVTPHPSGSSTTDGASYRGSILIVPVYLLLSELNTSSVQRPKVSSLLSSLLSPIQEDGE